MSMPIKNKRFTPSFSILLFISVIIFIFIAPSTLLQGFAPEQQRTVGLLVLAIYLWTASPLPTGAASILLLAMMIGLSLVESVEGAMVGFVSSALYFIMVLTILSRVLSKVGVDRVIASQLMRLNKRGPKAIVVALPIMMALLPVLMPSAFARLKMLLPFVDRLNDSFGFSERSIFKKYAMYVIGVMNQNGTMIVYTGGGFPILAAQLLSDYQIADLSWMEWILVIAPPLWTVLIVVNIFAWNYLKYAHGHQEWDEKGSGVAEEEVHFENRRGKNRFWFVLLTFIIMILIWVFTDSNHLPILLPPMLLLVLYSLPRVDLLDNSDIRAFDWENFLLLGTSFSIGILLEENGTASEIANRMLEFLPESAGMLMNIIFVAIVIFLFRMIFVVPSSAIIVIFPVVISYANITGIPALSLGFLVLMIVGGANIFPIHSPTSYFAFQTNVLSRKDHYVIASFSTFIFIIVSIIAAATYWTLWR